MKILFIIGPSIQVRRQDKYRESKFIPLEVYVEHIDEYYEILQVGVIFSASSIFLNTVKFFWPWSKVRLYLIKFAYLSTVKNIWTHSKNIEGGRKVGIGKCAAWNSTIVILLFSGKKRIGPYCKTSFRCYWWARHIG